MNADFFSNFHEWSGGYYELSVEYHPVGNNSRVNKALTALCKMECFWDIWADKKEEQKLLLCLPITIEEDSVRQFYGALACPHSSQVELPCVITVCRVEGQSDWLDIAIPQAAFERVYQSKYPLTLELNPWLKQINELLVQVAETIYASAPFHLAMIGEEISGYTNGQQITAETVQKGIFLLPSALQERLGLNEDGMELSNDLKLFPKNFV